MRSAKVYRGDTLVLDVEDRPGVLLSTATPPPGGAPEHAFVNARAHDPFTEGELATVLGGSADYTDFLQRLQAAGFTVDEQQ